MVSVETESAALDGTTYVRALVTNSRSTPQVVRLESTLSAPVWTPHPHRTTASSWEDGTWEGVVEPGRCRGVGFATPADVDDESVLRVVSVSRAAPADREASAAEALAALPEWSPTRDLVRTDR